MQNVATRIATAGASIRQLSDVGRNAPSLICRATRPKQAFAIDSREAHDRLIKGALKAPRFQLQPGNHNG